MQSFSSSNKNHYLNFKPPTQYGFTLTEVVIMVAIIGILAAIAIPTYQQYITKAQRSACLSEVKSYSNQVFIS